MKHELTMKKKELEIELFKLKQGPVEIVRAEVGVTEVNVPERRVW